MRPLTFNSQHLNLLVRDVSVIVVKVGGPVDGSGLHRMGWRRWSDVPDFRKLNTK